MIDFRRLMTSEQRAKYDAQKVRFDEDIAEAKAMDNAMLADKVEYYLTQCEQVRKWVPGDPVYDSQVFHVLVPEMIRRLRGGSGNKS